VVHANTARSTETAYAVFNHRKGSGETVNDSGAETSAVPVDLRRACTPRWSASSSRV